MTNLLATSVRHHHAALLRVAGVDAVYVRGNDAVELRLVPGQQRPEQYGQDVEEVVADGADWIVAVEELFIAGEAFKPSRGDEVRVDGVVFEVVHRGEADAWRYSDQHRHTIRIFTQEIRADEE